MYLNVSKLAAFLIISFVLSSCGLLKHNRIKNKQQHGYWITYADNDKKIILTKGRYKNGVQVGKWTYNTFSGVKERTEIYRGKKMRITHFHANGKIAVKGKAKIVVDNAKLHFYYYGPWEYYTETGLLQKISYYENGKLMREEYKIKSVNATYDSLIQEFIQLNKDFTKYRDTLSAVNKLYGIKSEQYKSIWRLNKQNDSLIYLRIENITTKFGYPEKKYVGENNSIIFFIISFAPLAIKEKYLELFRSAAEKGDIKLSDFAYFEDKYSVAKAGWQIYGTQYKTGKDYKEIYYPVKKLAELNDRRKRMNLDVVNLLDYIEITE